MKEIGLLFVRYPDPLSEFIRHICRGRFTHIALSTDSGMDQFYSFNFKGFAIETKEKYIRTGALDSCLYTFNISDVAQSIINNKIERFLEKREKLAYSRLGVVLSLIHIPINRENKYFCSEFVAETLKESKAIEIPKKPQLYLPNHIAKIMDKQNCNIIDHYII